MTVLDLSIESGLSQSTISNIINLKSDANYGAIIKLSKCFDIDLTKCFKSED